MKQKLLTILLILFISNLNAQTNMNNKKTRGQERILYSTLYDYTNGSIIKYDSTQYFYTQFEHFDLSTKTFHFYITPYYPYYNFKTRKNEFYQSLKFTLDSNQIFHLVDSTINAYNSNTEIKNEQISDFLNARYQGSEYSYINSKINSIKDTFTNSVGSNIFHKEFIYDSSNNLVKVNEYQLINSVDSLIKTDSLFYDPNNNLDKVQTYSYDNFWGWSKFELYNYYYDQNSNLTSEELYWWWNFGNYYEPMNIRSYDYDINNRITNVYTGPSWNGGFVYGNRRELRYNSNNLYPDTIYMYYAPSPTSGPVINDVIETYLYNSNNLIEEVKTFWLQTSTTLPVKIRKDYYESYIPLETQLIQNNNIEIFPNPCKSKISIRNSNSINKLIIYNRSGQLLALYENKSNDNSFEIDISKLPNDFYLLKSIGKNGALIRTDKILKQE